jgi:cell division protease FtsH
MSAIQTPTDPVETPASLASEPAPEPACAAPSVPTDVDPQRSDDLPPLDLDAALMGIEADRPQGASDRRGPLLRMRAERLPAAELIVLVAAEAALPRELLRDLARGRAVAAVITVPSPVWYQPLTDLIYRLSDGRAAVIEASSRARPGASGPEAEVSRAFAHGRPVVGVATSPELLPAVLAAAADHRASLPPPGAEVMAEAIRRWCPRGRRISLSADSLAGLDLPDLAAALRPRSTPNACRARLERASCVRLGPPAGPPLPPLDDLAVTGPARDWALGLVADIGRVRAGALPASALEAAVFFGPPGTGKTLLALCIAAEARVPFLQTSVGAWFATNGYLDGVIKCIDAFCDGLLQAARAHGTAVGYFDECDALPSRDNLSHRGRDWWTPVINHALLRIQALREAGVVLLAATNHLHNLDAALLRPGRFDRTFWVGPPDEAARVAILRAHLAGDLPEADLVPAARLSSGATGAVLAGHVKAARVSSDIRNWTLGVTENWTPFDVRLLVRPA